MLGWLARIFSWRRKQTRRFLERLVLAEGVVQTLFNDYAEHRRSDRGHEEIGWVLLGVRQDGETIALAALPAGAQRDAGAAHVQFHSDAQALASRILRQQDKRLRVIGIVHTHPGNLCVPSDGDLHGDRAWIRQLRDHTGVFGIGTAGGCIAPAAHVQTAGDMSFHWYALRHDDDSYRDLPISVTDGLDLASALRPIWGVIEAHAAPLLRLCGQFGRIDLATVNNGLAAIIPLAASNQQLRVLFNEGEARYYWDRNGELIAIDPHESQVDRAVYLILAELAQSSAPREILEGA